MATRTKPTVASRALNRAIRPIRPRIGQKKLADELGVTQQAVSLWLTHRATPEKDLRPRIAELLGIPEDAWDVPSPEEEASGPSIADADSTGERQAVNDPTGTEG